MNFLKAIIEECLKAEENVKPYPGRKNYHFQKFVLVENCLLVINFLQYIIKEIDRIQENFI